ncbi:flavin mononucleotide hydrolase 1, chloroplatic-like [Pistacia vera]|uniref:flavin mononucleotide hydrolase 1, chloroplatic-like n=1 Tax=Pistacia vera TaxID=55513 RepID=UPI001262B1A4|nr:flavin mononucleotide hydrolase 1, chloroplatic-like [Pistacia vera]
MAALSMRVPTTLSSTTAIPLKPSSRKPIRISLNPSFKNITKRPLMASLSGQTQQRKLPILLFDIMDTIVRDPFYQDVPAFFGMPMKELIECKHPTAWLEFEKGLIDEMELARKFFKDGRPFDLEGKREPDPDFYLEVVRHLKVDSGDCIFIDDRLKNVEAATEVGIVGLQFKGAIFCVVISPKWESAFQQTNSQKIWQAEENCLIRDVFVAVTRLNVTGT